MASKRESNMEKMKSSSKRSGEMSRRNLLTVHHERLYRAFSLGTRVYDGKEWKWQCADIEIQKHVIRSIASFLDCVSGDIVHNSLVKDSIVDIVGALVWILQRKINAVLSITADLVVKLINIIPSTLLQPFLLDLVHPLSSLLSYYQLEVSILCAIALNMIFLNLSLKREKEVWDILIETGAVSHIVSGIRKVPDDGVTSIKYFQEMTTLLSNILQRWPPSRYYVWNDAELLKVLEVMHMKPDFPIKVSVLKLYSAIALCGNGAKKLLQNGEALVQMMILCMGRSHPFYVRTEGFRLAQCLVTDEEGCSKLMSLCCEPIVSALIDGMSGWTSNSGKFSNDEMSILVEACHIALMMNRWPGEHHNFMWEHGIDQVLLNLLLDFHGGPSISSLPLEEQMSIAEEGLKTNFLLSLRPYIWELLGWLVTHCKEEFGPSICGRELKIDFLITCACISFVDSIRQGRQIRTYDVNDTFRCESASRAILMMIYSPSKYIASKARFILYEILKPTGKEYVNYLLRTLNTRPSKDDLGVPYVLRTSINLVALVCFSCFPQYHSHIDRSAGIRALLGFSKWYLSNDIHIGRPSLVPHLRNRFSERICCWSCNEDWEGNDILLLYSLCGMAELIHSGYVGHKSEIFDGQVDYTEAQFVNALQEICITTTSPGIKWYAAFILSYFGLYGFPCKLGRRIGRALNANEYADLHLVLSNRDCISVHGVLLAVRCPSLIPPEEFPCYEKAFGGSSIGYDIERKDGTFQKEIYLSSHVDNQALSKLLEFVYLGYLNAGEELVKKVKILVKRCSIPPLLQMLTRRHPKWGKIFPKYDLSLALTPSKHCFTDIILEAKAAESPSWVCSVCSKQAPHMHCHKVVLWSSCDYLRALFQSGMVESNSQTIKMPVSWEAMVKLVNWWYTDEISSPPSGCLWDNMSNEERLQMLQPYVELCWLAEFWFLEYIQDISYGIIISCLDSAKHLSIKMIKLAADFSLWKLVEVAANYLAPLYRQLCHSGELEGLDEQVIDMIRIASIRLSQEG
ncbi:BTB/POZ domain-containing protein At1g04390 [Mercurialis annua]|uniref:BTB/POZ domain-containing protein At1g04390 n=1 Tax=Mercurialis annua TaxID=3986 RepID=UPI002160D2D3|nr:BTB/POZ domain-containing protein At1g04390 [Mercurialis annua]